MRRSTATRLLTCLTLCLATGAGLCQAPPVEVHGYIQNRMYTNPYSPAEFAVERLSLSTLARMENNIQGYVEVYFYPGLAGNAILVESAYADFPWGGGRVRVGKGRQLNFGIVPTYPNRKTSQYGILSETFTQDRIVGVQYSWKKGKLDLGASAYTDLQIGLRQAGFFAGAQPVNFVNHFSERDGQTVLGSGATSTSVTAASATSDRMAVSVKLGTDTPRYRAHVSFAEGDLNPQNASGIMAPWAGANTNQPTDHRKWGVDLAWAPSPFIAVGEWYQGDFSALRLTGYQVILGYEPKDKVRGYLKYAAISSNQPVIAANQLTWDIQQFTIGIAKPIQKGVWVEIDYEKNMERGGTSRNDILFVELFTGW